MRASNDSRELGEADLVLFCVKTYDTEAAARMATPLVGSGTTVLTLQNGVDNRDRIGRVLGDQAVLAGSAYISSVMVSPGVIQHKGGTGKLVLGEPDGTESTRVRDIRQAFVSSGVPCEISPDITTVLWQKMAWICAMAGMNCIARLPLGPILKTGASRSMFRRILQEVVTLGNVSGASISDDYVDQTMATADSWDKTTFSSMYRDLVDGKRLELEALHGTVVRLGRQRKIPVDMNEAVYSALKPNDEGRK